MITKNRPAKNQALGRHEKDLSGFAGTARFRSRRPCFFCSVSSFGASMQTSFTSTRNAQGVSCAESEDLRSRSTNQCFVMLP